MSEAEKKQTRDQFADWFRAKCGEDTGEDIADQPAGEESAPIGYPTVKDAGEPQYNPYQPTPKELFVEYMAGW